MRGLVFIALLATYLPSAFIQPFCGVLLWTWFSIMNPHRETFGYANTMPYAMIIALVTVFAFFLSREPKRLRIDMVSASLVALLVAVSISTLMALKPELAYPKWDRVAKTLFFCLISLALMTNRTRLHAFAWVMVLAIGYYSVKGGIFSLMTGGQYHVFGPEATYIGDNNHLALAIIMAVPLMYYLYQQSRHWVVRAGMLLAIPLSLIAVLFTYSRGGFLALIAMGGILTLRSRYKIPIFAGCLAIGLAVAWMAPAQWFDRMASIATYQEDNSANARLRIWAVSLKIFAANPFFGGGFRATYSRDIVESFASGEESRAVHNSHLEVLVESGLAGFIPHLLLLFGSLAYCQRVLRLTRKEPNLSWARDLASMLQVSLVGYAVGGTFLSLGYYDGWYNLAIMTAALHAVVLRERLGHAARPGERPAWSPYPAKTPVPTRE